ncbi:MAG: hypothetical protein LAT67_03235 [Balneolales bacterium]|nr:hypothetical protein [Balneolales bacterium]
MDKKAYIKSQYDEHLGSLRHHASFKEHRMLDEGAFADFFKSQRKKAVYRFSVAILCSVVWIVYGFLNYSSFIETDRMFPLILTIASSALVMAFLVIGCRDYFRKTLLLDILEEKCEADSAIASEKSASGDTATV